MFEQRVNKIREVLKAFTGKNGEPSDESDTESYILSSMWVMLVSEFEGSIKNLVESHIDEVKKGKIEDVHICILVQNFYGDIDEKISISQVLDLYNSNISDISYHKFTRNKVPKQKSYSVEKLFNSIGIFLSDNERTDLKMLDGITSTRDSIAHGDHLISITRQQLEDSITILVGVYDFLKVKVSS